MTDLDVFLRQAKGNLVCPRITHPGERFAGWFFLVSGFITAVQD